MDYGDHSERRVVPAAHLRTLKEAGRPARLQGYAAVFDSDSVDLGFVERIAPGAFTDALAKKPDVRALFNHDENLPLGRTKNRTLRLLQDARGLWVEILLADTQLSRDLAVWVARGDIDQMSFAFDLPPRGDSWERLADGSYRRLITKIGNLYDVSVVTFPAYPDTEVALKSLRASAAWSADTAAEGALRARLDRAVEAYHSDLRRRLDKAVADFRDPVRRRLAEAVSDARRRGIPIRRTS